MTTQFRCRLWESCGRLNHFWEHTVGSGHAALALRSDWQAQLKKCRDELGFQHVRFHAILCDSMGVLVCEEGKLVYSFHNADLIFDFLLSIGMKPFVELSFMPEALASGHKTVFHYQANVTPPTDYRAWAALILKLIAHWVDRYGLAEVRKWYFEVWNEPNLKAFWPASRDEYFKLYRVTAQALKKVDTKLRVGGPVTANNQWIAEFLHFADKRRAPVDFVSTHHYPTDALGSGNQDTLSELAETRRSILRQWAQDARRQTGDRPLYYTEWNSSSNPNDPLHDEPYAAPVVIKTMMEANGLANGYSFWTFSDIFSENYFPSLPFHGGFGLLTLHGIAKPTYRAFEILHTLGDELLVVDGLHPTVDCWVVKTAGAVEVLLTNHALPRHYITPMRVHVQLECRRAPRDVYVRRIDERHANPKRAWNLMGRPKYPSDRQLDRLNKASCLTRERQPWRFIDQTLYLDLTMPPHSVASVTLRFSGKPPQGGPFHATPTHTT